jgi:hypothetical protein
MLRAVSICLADTVLITLREMKLARRASLHARESASKRIGGMNRPNKPDAQVEESSPSFACVSGLHKLSKRT